MKNVVLLAMHGSPPLDFPRGELIEFFELHGRFHNSNPDVESELYRRFIELDKKICGWVRTPQNDPYYFGAMEVVESLRKIIGMTVLVGFNEFCEPSMERSFDKAVEIGATKILVSTTMTTHGGSHAERDIPIAIEAARIKYPDVIIKYVWPFDNDEVATFLAKQIMKSF
jgi:sirohydrochlorin cobaltochelatase